MNIDNLKSMIKRHEGLRKRPYDDATGEELKPGMTLQGYLTVGYGHFLHNDLSDIIIEELFENDLGIAIQDCASIYPNWNELPEGIQTVLIDMCFNLGRPGLQKFKKMNRAIEDQNWVRMLEEMRDSNWYHQVKDRAVELEEIVRSVT